MHRFRVALPTDTQYRLVCHSLHSFLFVSACFVVRLLAMTTTNICFVVARSLDRRWRVGDLRFWLFFFSVSITIADRIRHRLSRVRAYDLSKLPAEGKQLNSVRDDDAMRKQKQSLYKLLRAFRAWRNMR
jgi:hypothetical protein